ncbi:MAG: transposase [gamma proteobacterium symbiont of Ctena orbiculata]|nr:MAG: transposase [gamma proteobacterium symbiont of Ctena orbiculata]
MISRIRNICAYAVMSNHYHVVLHVDTGRASEWNEQDIIERWGSLFSLPVIVERFISKDAVSNAERNAVSELIAKWRTRLQDISWFMRCLNEPIARQANHKDGCIGRYWEGRYKSQALLDEKALAACMAYVDLNPVRAGLAETPEQSDYTSIAERTKELKQGQNPIMDDTNPSGLLPFVGNPRQHMPTDIPFRFADYLELLDWTGRAILDHKRGCIPGNQPPILTRLQIDPTHWLYMTQHFESSFKGLVGAIYKLRVACQHIGYQRTPNLTACKRYFG